MDNQGTAKVEIEVKPQGDKWQVFIDGKAPFEPMDKAAAEKLAGFLRFNRDNREPRINSRYTGVFKG